MGFGQAKTLGFNNQPLARLIVANSIINSKGMFFYSGTPALGNLIESVGVAVAGTDKFGNVYQAGDTVYSVPAGSAAQLNAAVVQFGTLAQFAGTGGKQPALISLTSGIEGTLALATGLNGSTDSVANLLLWSKNAGGAGQPFVQLQTVLELASPVSVIQQGDTVLFDNANAFPQFIPGSVIGDTTTYKIGHRAFWSTTDQNITSTTFATVCGSAAVGNGAYRVRAVLQVLQGAISAKNNFRLGFTGTISQVRMKASFVGSGGVANSVFCQTTTTNNGLLQAPAFVANAQYVAEIEGIIITSSTGTLSIQAAEDTAGDPFTVQALSLFEISPAN